MEREDFKIFVEKNKVSKIIVENDRFNDHLKLEFENGDIVEIESEWEYDGSHFEFYHHPKIALSDTDTKGPGNVTDSGNYTDPETKPQFKKEY